MMIDIHRYIIPLGNLDQAKILSTWMWLIGNDKNIVALTKAGDVLLKNYSDNLYFLDTGIGNLSFLYKNYLDFFANKLDAEIGDEILLPLLIDRMEDSGHKLGIDQVYSYILLPIIGGEYDKSNVFISGLYEHYNLTGEIHFQLKDMPDGTVVNIAVK